MDYYQLLKVSPDASQKDIEDAYNRLVKESRYNATIDKRDVEKAYRILIDPQQKALYDSIQDQKSKKAAAAQNVAAGKIERKRKVSPEQRRRRLVTIFAIILVLSVGYFWLRFGHFLKSFEEGDILYYNGSNQRMGRILQVERNHDFGKAKLPAYLIKTNDREVWIPQSDVKALCYAQE